MWQRFGHGFGDVVLRAAEMAEKEQARDLSSRHLLRALAIESELPAAQILSQLGVTLAKVETMLRKSTPAEQSPNGDEPSLTIEARDSVERAYRLAADLQDQYIGGEHLLLAFLQKPDGSDAGRILTALGIDLQKVGQLLMAMQKWRIVPLGGIPVPSSRIRKLKALAHKKGGRVKRLAYGLANSQQPFMPYVMYRDRTTEDPYPFYTRLRQKPVYWDTLINQWVVTGYDDVAAALAEPRFSRRTFTLSAWGKEDLPPLIEREFRRLDGSIGHQMLFLDSPDHLRQRSLVAKQFTPRVIARMREQMQEITDELLEAVTSAGRMEVVADLASPMPITVISRMLGVPEEDAAQFKKWTNDFIAYLGGETTLSQNLEAYQSFQELSAYFQELIPRRRSDPQEDLITLLVQADEEGQRLSEKEVIANCLLLLAAGHENTTRLISSGLLALMNHPDQMQRLREDPTLLPSAVEELLRYDGPVQWTGRVVGETFDWNGRRFEKGERVTIGLAAANRDPAKFPDADRLDISRTPNRHLAFGNGPHFCLGAALTRMEGQVVFGALLTKYPRLRLDGVPVRSHSNFIFREILSLPIRMD